MRIKMWPRGLFTTILLAAACFSPAAGMAQESDDLPDPITWSLKATSTDSGRTILLELTAKIQNGWHLYSTERIEGGPSPTRIILPDDQGLEVAGEIDSPAPHSALDPNFQIATESYEGSVTFKLPVKAQTSQIPGKIRVVLRYQTCSSTICLPPKMMQLETALNGNPRTAESVPTSEPAVRPYLLTTGAIIPDFKFTDFDGKPRSFFEFRGRFLLLDFWASWCSPCLADIPELQRIYRKFKRQDFEILGLDSETLGQKNVEADFLRQSQSNAHLIVTSRGVSWPQSPNETSVPIAQRFGFETLPAKILIDRDGLFVKRINKISELEALLDSLLKTKP